MTNILFLSISVIGIAVFSVATFFIMNIGANKKTYYKTENNDTYVVYKWFSGRGEGYKAYKFKKNRNKLIFLQRKITFSDLLPLIIISGIFFVIFVIKAGLLTGIGISLYFILVSVGFSFALHKYNVSFCKRFLLKKLNFR